MKVLENSSSSPVEALALNYLSFGFLTVLNNFWTWLAFSFWKAPIRIRSSNQPELLPPGPTTSDSPDPVAASGDAAVDVDVDGVTKGKLKFTLHYYEDDTGECQSDGAEEEREEEEEEWLERLLRLRRGEFENGWYTWQDLTVLNGNVVRFWDGHGHGATTTTTLAIAATGESSSSSASTCVRVW